MVQLFQEPQVFQTPFGAAFIEVEGQGRELREFFESFVTSNRYTANGELKSLEIFQSLDADEAFDA